MRQAAYSVRNLFRISTMEFTAPPKKLKLLVCADIDTASSTRIAELFVPQQPQFDAVILLGPFIHEELLTAEANVIAEGDIASIIAQFENIVCRVIYLPSENDPAKTLTEQLHLTPNSVNIHARKLSLAANLSISGFTERGDNTTLRKPERTGEESDDEMDNVEIRSGLSMSIISEIIAEGEKLNSSAFGGASNKANQPTGLFVLSYKFAHTLNQFLFHIPDQLEASGTDIIIVNSPDAGNSPKFPSKLGKLSIISPGSLRRDNQYSTLELVFHEATNKWIVSNVTQEII